MNFHHVLIRELYAIAEAQRARAEVMHMHVARAAMRLELEMMVFDVLPAVAHLSFAAANVLRPNYFSGALDGDFAGHGLKIGINYEFRAKRAGADFRAGQVQVILFLKS